ncbi:MAG: hypothetical protein BWK80_32705 [Desulfobacteraceae bacterium IS3]|nr:MAG: hypothetical protein BWK80_32705 [Desulfobacteraceae bacterium IS3]
MINKTVMAFRIGVLLLSLNAAEAGDLCFQPGEKLIFELKWSFIKAGEATLEVMPIETFNGISAYHFVMTAESIPAIDLIYKIRDRIDAYTDIGVNRSLLYKKKQKEGRSIRDITLSFDWDKKTAQYTNFKEVLPPIPIMDGSFDPLSAFYYTRLIDLKENMVIERPITDGKKNVIGKVSVVRREKIKIGENTYDTYLLEPELREVGGVFEKSKGAKLQVWVSADERKIPVRVKSKVAVGSFIGELISATGVK